MAKENKVASETSVEALENALTRTEQYIESNQKSLTIIVIAIVVIIGAYLGYKKLYLAPMESEAQEQVFTAERYFEQDSFKLALNGDGNNPGFLKLIEKYGPTKVANLSQYYAGISYRELGQYEEAIKHLKKFDASDKVIRPIALGAIGDCYVELEKYEDGASFYKKAASYDDNSFTAPIYLLKAGVVYEKLGKYSDAVKVYETIKKDYPQSTEARDIEKYIERAKQLM